MRRAVYPLLLSAGLLLFTAGGAAADGMVSKGLKIDPLLEQAIKESAQKTDIDDEIIVPVPEDPLEIPALPEETVKEIPAQAPVLIGDEPEMAPPVKPTLPPKPMVVTEPPPERHKFHWPEKPGQKYGGLLFLPSLLLRTGWNDNVFATDSTHLTGDMMTTFNPRLRVEIPDIQHTVTFDGSWEARAFMSNSSENIDNVSAQLSGELAADKGVSVPFGLGWKRLHEERDEDLLQELPRSPLAHTDFNVDGGVRFKPGSFGLALLGHYTQERFEDGYGKFTGARVVRSDANRDIMNAEFDASFDFDNQNTLMLIGTAGKRDYQRQNFQAGGFVGPERDSHTYGGMMSWLFDFASLKGHASIGLSDFTYNDPAIDDIRAVTGDIELDHQFSERTSANIQFEHSIQEDAEIVDPYLKTRAGLYFDHQAWDNVLIAAGADYNYLDFTNSPRQDESWDFRIIGDYFYNDFLSFGLEYGYTWRNSNVAGLDFDRNVFMLRARGRL